jgi:hypothetical protein
MKKFLALYMAPIANMEEMMKTTTPEQQQAGMAEWQKWMDSHKANLTDPGAPLGKTKEVTPKGVVDTKNDLGGYTVLEANSHDEAAQIFKDSPHFAMMPGATVQVIEIMEMSGA